MKKIMRAVTFLACLLVGGVFFSSLAQAAQQRVEIQFFFSSGCKHCLEIEEDFLPRIIEQYKDKVILRSYNIAEKENFQLLLAIEKKFHAQVRVPAILIGSNLIIGSEPIKEHLVNRIEEYLANPSLSQAQLTTVNLLERFRSFSPHAIIIAGLIDGINPCAFTVIIFFISFLTLMGYKKADIGAIGGAFIAGVFATYLAIGLGVFRGLYELQQFYLFLKITYALLAVFCFVLAIFNIADAISYWRSKNTAALKVKLPHAVRKKINAIIAAFYRKDQEQKERPHSRFALALSALAVGFLISLLEAVCTGQVYLPTIVFILKEPALRAKALIYLLLYNVMFIVPLVVILFVVLFGVQSKSIEDFFRKRVGLVKLLMAFLFLGLGMFLLWGL